MKIRDIVKKSKRELSITIALVGVIPFLVFIYLMTVKISSVNIFLGEVGLIMILTLLVFFLGIWVGKRMIFSFVSEIIEKDRKAAITEAALAVGHEISNPLLAIRGNLQILESYAVDNQLPDTVINRIKTMIDSFERIRQVTDQFINASNLNSRNVFGKINMTDIR